MSIKQNKQIPLGLTEGERKTLKGFRILPCLWHSWGWKKSVVYSILIYPHQSEGKPAIFYWKKAHSSRGSVWNLKANTAHWSTFQVHYKSPAVGGIPAPAEWGLDWAVEHAALLFDHEPSSAGIIHGLFRPPIIPPGRTTAQATRVLEQGPLAGDYSLLEETFLLVTRWARQGEKSRVFQVGKYLFF